MKHPLLTAGLTIAAAAAIVAGLTLGAGAAQSCTTDAATEKAQALSGRLIELAIVDPVRMQAVSDRLFELADRIGGANAAAMDLAEICAAYDEMLAEAGV